MPLATVAPPLLTSDLALPGLRRGKVRDVYDLPPARDGSPRLLIIATDRISAFDVVMPTPIPGKGRLLTQLSTFWLRFVESRELCRTHLISPDVTDVPASAFKSMPGATTRAQLDGRIMICRAAKVIPIECVARGYVEGSGWKEYQATGSICGVALPRGLKQCDKIPDSVSRGAIFTPATKEELGKHDENITFERACELAPGCAAQMHKLRDLTLAIYRSASDHARARGIIIADTKFEFGVPISPATDGASATSAPILIDEVLTPDSSRFWPLDSYSPGRAQKSFDKQFLREYLETLVAAGRWNKQAPGPELPAEIAERTLAKYREACDRLMS